MILAWFSSFCVFIAAEAVQTVLTSKVVFLNCLVKLVRPITLSTTFVLIQLGPEVELIQYNNFLLYLKILYYSVIGIGVQYVAQRLNRSSQPNPMVHFQSVIAVMTATFLVLHSSSMEPSDMFELNMTKVIVSKSKTSFNF